MQWTGENPQGPLTIHVFTGADGSFTLYEDNGEDMGYARGEFVRISLKWDDARRTLTLGRREGTFPGMAATRRIELVIHDGTGEGDVFAATPARTAVYSGEPLTISP